MVDVLYHERSTEEKLRALEQQFVVRNVERVGRRRAEGLQLGSCELCMEPTDTIFSPTAGRENQTLERPPKNRS